MRHGLKVPQPYAFSITPQVVEFESFGDQAVDILINKTVAPNHLPPIPEAGVASIPERALPLEALSDNLNLNPEAFQSEHLPLA